MLAGELESGAAVPNVVCVIITWRVLKTQMLPIPAHFRVTGPDVGREFALKTGDGCQLKPTLLVRGLPFEILAQRKRKRFKIK